MNGNLSVIYYAADGLAAGLRIVERWVDVATVEGQIPSARRRGSTYRPEVAVRALAHRRARRVIDGASIRKREWELACNILAADGEAVGLIAVALWVDSATVEGQGPSVRSRVGAYRPEVAVRALAHRRARRSIDIASIRKREWELE